MAEQNATPGKVEKAFTEFVGWMDERFPLVETWEYHLSKYYAPKNFNFWYLFGVLSIVVLVIQLVTGVWLTMSYSPATAFASVEYIMRDVEYGWLLRYLHSTGASAFFVVVYLHMFRGMMYGSYRKPRELLWIIGMAIFAVLIIEGFAGYLLPWGNMSFWAGQVIVSLVGAIPVIGPDLMALWVRGDFLMSDITLNRFFALHVIALPLVLVMLVFVHIVALHHVGSNNPDGVEIKKNKDENGIPLDGIQFHPYYTIGHDMPAIALCSHLLLRGGVLRAGDGRLFPREAQLRGGQSAEDPRAHRPGLVLHALLRDVESRYFPAVRHTGQVLGLGCDGRRHRHPVRTALARPLPGQVDPLQGLDFQVHARSVRG